MTDKIITTKIEVCQFEELPSDEQHLVELARKATKASYSPYSQFRVGAALMLANGVCIKGANQENAAFPAGLCAERSAIFNAGSNYPGVAITKLAVTAWTGGDFVKDPCSPCGVCRQAILEFETQSGKPIEILLVGRDSVYRVASIKDLLPLCFTEF